MFSKIIILLLVTLVTVKTEDDCGGTTSFLPSISPFKFKAEKECKHTFVGDKSCIPEVTCSVQSDECTVVADGVGSSEICKGDSKKYSSTNHYLFVTTTGSTCTASCASTASNPLPLKAPKPAQCKCGIKNKDDRIVGGEDAKQNEFPWQVAIVFKNTRSPKCGGSIINDRYVLTAAHCFVLEKTKPESIQVLYNARLLDFTLQKGWKDVELGRKGSIRGSGYKEKKVNDKEEGSIRYNVVEIINHPLFTAKYDFDVSLLKLDKKIDLTKDASPTPICLPKDTTLDYIGKKPWVVGWGLSDEGAGASTRALQKLEVPVLPISKCQKWMPYVLSERMLCAGYEEGKKDACTGDSGGPLALEMDDKKTWHQIGVVSWGEGCARDHRPGLYSRVTELQGWIRHNSKGAAWCQE